VADNTPTEEFDSEEVDLSQLSPEELEIAKEYLIEEYNLKREETVEFNSADGLTELREIAEAIKLIDAEFGAREELAELDSFVSFASTEAENEDDADDVEDESADTDVVVTADEPALSPKGIASDAPPASEAPALVASIATDIPGYFKSGQVVGTGEVAKALIAKRSRTRGASEAASVYDIVASIHGDYPEDRILTDNPVTNSAIIDRVTSTQALVASGGICNQLTPYYPLTTLGDVNRPVRDALPSFRADRGGIRYNGAPVLGDLTVATANTGADGAIRITTEAADKVGYDATAPVGGAAFKPCLHVSCKPEASVTVDAISRCLKFGNFGSRTYPEQVEAWTKLSMVQWARVAEQKMLADIAAQSTAVTHTQKYSPTRSILNAVDVAVAAYKSRHRIATAVKLRALFPEWVKNLVRVDLATAGVEPIWSVSDAQVADWFSVRGIVPTFYLDSRSASPQQVFGAQTAGALLDFPTSVEWYLFAEGSFLHLDGGSLDLGVVRDSSLNAANDFSIFAESWEAVAFVGVEALKVVSSGICPTGSGSASTAVIAC
jgi:hypothetical protein